MFSWLKERLHRGPSETDEADLFAESDAIATAQEDMIADQQEAIVAVLEAAGACRAKIADRLQRSQAESTNEVIGAGAQINAIVDTARKHVESGNTGLESLATEQLRAMRAYSQHTEAKLQEQREVVEKALSLSTDIFRVGASIQKLANAAHLLALNTRVEATNLGEQGRTVSVLAGEMKNLSDAIQQANRTASQLAAELTTCLPQIAQHAEEMRERTDGIVTTIEDFGAAGAKSAEEARKESEKVIGAVMESAYAALSHLQYHDPEMQRLLGIDTVLADFLSEQANAHDVSIDIAERLQPDHHVGQSDDDSDDEGGLGSGEVLLF